MSWVLVTWHYLHDKPLNWDCAIDEESKAIFWGLIGFHTMLTISGLIIYNNDLTAYGDGPTELHGVFTLIFVVLFPLVFIARNFVVSRMKKFAFASDCKNVQKDGIGCFSCFGNRNNVTDEVLKVKEEEGIKLASLFQCSVSDVMKSIPEDSDIKSYGIMRRKNSRYKF